MLVMLLPVLALFHLLLVFEGINATGGYDNEQDIAIPSFVPYPHLKIPNLNNFVWTSWDRFPHNFANLSGNIPLSELSGTPYEIFFRQTQQIKQQEQQQQQRQQQQSKTFRSNDGYVLDSIQVSALRDGLFLPLSSTEPEKNHSEGEKDGFHIFSSKEARTCLKGKKIAFAGDSYVHILRIGLMDILTGTTSNRKLMHHNERVEESNFLEKLMKQRAPDTTTSWVYNDCWFDVINCTTDSIVKEFKNAADRDVLKWDSLVMNQQIHHTNRQVVSIMNRSSTLPFIPSNLTSQWAKFPSRGAILFKMTNFYLGDKAQTRTIMKDYLDEISSNYFQDLQMLFKTANAFNLNVTYLTGVASQNVSKESRDRLILNNDIFKASNLQSKIRVIPVLNAYILTFTCKWGNCTDEGCHRARFVMRMEAQILLNMFCSIK